jgi:hypothetical protein
MNMVLNYFFSREEYERCEMVRIRIAELMKKA